MHDRRGDLTRPWLRSDRRIPKLVVRPVQRFLNTEVSGGLLLLAAAVIALIWANSPWGDWYEKVWHTQVSITVGPWQIHESLQHVINDGLMAIFFFVVGLEIKREFVAGELRDLRTAALSFFGAAGGMVVPALLFLLINSSGEAARGWGIPMATDIAFAVGILAILAKGLPSGAKLFLLSLAIVDDIGAIIVIAVFYSEGIEPRALAAAAVLILIIVGLEKAHVRTMFIYVLLGAGVWLAVFQSGVHATIAGVVLGLLTPAIAFHAPKEVSDEARKVAERTGEETHPSDAESADWLWLARVAQEAVSPLTRLEHLLHPWTSFVIVPLFALANAGVRVSPQSLAGSFSNRVTVGIIAGLVLGKLAGITLGAWIGVRLKLARLPAGIRWPHLTAVAAVAGVGFTVSLFIAELAFKSEDLLESAKIGVLAASVMAAVVGGLLLKLAGRRDQANVPERAE